MNTPLESLRSAVRLRCARVTAMVAVAGRRSDRSLDLCASCRHPVSPHASLTFSFFSSNNGAFRSVDAGGPTQICLVLHEEAKTILIGGAGVGAVSFGEQRGAQNIWWWPAALSARAGPVRPEPVKASSFALGWLMTLATPTRAGYAGNCVPWPHARPRVSRDRSRHGGMPCYVTMVTTCHLTNGF